MNNESTTTTRYELEVGLIGCLLNDQDSIAEVATRVTADDFNYDSTRAIYQALVELQAEKINADRPFLLSRLNGKYAPVVDDVLAGCRTDAEPYISELHKANCLDLYHLSGSILSNAPDVETAAAEVDKLEHAIAQATGNGAEGASSLDEMVSDFIDNYDKPQNILTTGFHGLDKEVTPVPGNFIILGGYPSAGKTALSLQFGLKWAREGKRVIFFSCETNKLNLTCRILSFLTQIPLKTFICRKQLTNTQMRQLRQVQAMVKADDGKHFLIVNAACQTPDFIRAQAIAHHADIVFVDYLQLLHGTHRRGFENRQNEVAEVSRALADLARRQNIIVIALSQLTRPGPAGANGVPKAPDMHCFKESGQLEQDADIALVLFSQDPNDPSNDCPRLLTCVKNKSGDRPAIRLQLHGECQYFEDTTPASKTPPCESYDEDEEPLPF